MSNINQLTSQDTVSGADQFPVYVGGNGATRKVSAQAVAEYVQTVVTESGGLQTQYATTTATGQTTIVSPPTTGASVWLEMTPTGTFAAGTITLPAATVAQDGQEVLVTSTQIVTALTVNYLNASGVLTTIVGAPTTIAANGFFRMRFDPVFKLWIRIS